jgi:uncharacterized membrane protein YkoI
MSRRITKMLAAVAALAAFALGGAALAGATGNKSGDDASARDGRDRPNETPLTGDTADKVRAAALAEVPGGTIVRVETDEGGVYEAHVRKSDGTEVEVEVDKSFDVTDVEEHDGFGRGDHHGGRGPGRGEEPLMGDTATKVRDAAKAKVPGGTILRVETDSDGVYEAHVRKSDGTEVEVKVNKSFDVTAVEEHGRR